MNNRINAILELNLLGSYIRTDDGFRDFEEEYRNSLFNCNHNFETENQIDFLKIENSLTNAILPKLKGKRPVVMLSGGIDSTVIAHILYKNNIKFDACSYFSSENDEAIQRVAYLENKYGIESDKIIEDYNSLSEIYINYFKYYKSPNLDYAFLSMCSLVNEYCKKSKYNGDLIFLDGIEGDNLFGYSNNLSLNIKSIIRHFASRLMSRNTIYSNRKLNIYSSAMIDYYPYNSLYQNFIFPKLLEKGMLKKVHADINHRLIKPSRKGLSFNSKNMMGMLYYMGRRVAYKNYHPIKSQSNKVIYPYIDNDVLATGFALKNKLKISPYIKAPLKTYLLNEGYDKTFVLAPKKGMGLDIFKVISFEEVLESLTILEDEIAIKNDRVVKDYIYKLFKERDKAVDHFMFGLVMAAKYLKQYND